MVSDMPGDPRECRQHAARCAELAAEAKSDGLKQHFINLSRTWEKLAKDLERIPALASADFLNGSTPKPPFAGGSPKPPTP